MEEGVHRVSVAEAVELLCIGEGAVRKRITRGTLRTVRDEEGHVRVLLNDSGAHRGAAAGQPGGQGAPRWY